MEKCFYNEELVEIDGIIDYVENDDTYVVAYELDNGSVYTSIVEKEIKTVDLKNLEEILFKPKLKLSENDNEVFRGSRDGGTFNSKSCANLYDKLYAQLKSFYKVNENTKFMYYANDIKNQGTEEEQTSFKLLFQNLEKAKKHINLLLEKNLELVPIWKHEKPESGYVGGNPYAVFPLGSYNQPYAQEMQLAVLQSLALGARNIGTKFLLSSMYEHEWTQYSEMTEQYSSDEDTIEMEQNQL